MDGRRGAGWCRAFRLSFAAATALLLWGAISRAYSLGVGAFRERKRPTTLPPTASAAPATWPPACLAAVSAALHRAPRRRPDRLDSALSADACRPRSPLRIASVGLGSGQSSLAC